MAWLCASAVRPGSELYDVPPLDCAGALIVCWKPLSVVEHERRQSWRCRRSPASARSEQCRTQRLTLSGKMKTEDVCVSPSESVTVRMISYRVKPEKSCPEVGMSNVKFFTPLIGPTAGWMMPLVMEDDRPRERARRKRAVFRVCSAAGDRNVVAGNKQSAVGRRQDLTDGRSADDDDQIDERGIGSIGDSERDGVAAARGVGVGRVGRRRTRAITEVPGVGERIAVRIARARARET